MTSAHLLLCEGPFAHLEAVAGDAAVLVFRRLRHGAGNTRPERMAKSRKGFQTVGVPC